MRKTTTRKLHLDRLVETYGDPPESSDERFVAFDGDSAGATDYDEFGQPRWKWAGEIKDGSAPPSVGDTSTYLKALSNESLEVADDPGASPKKPTGGFNPYDTQSDTARIQRKRKLRR